MILRMPSYYRDFKCTADKCTDSCCIGWEIDIDKQSLKRFRAISDSEFSDKLKRCISESGTPHFILDENERCPFLDKNGLCEMILYSGEDILCNICRDHPRYFEWYDGLKEGGIGLCCEAAAKLILQNNNCTSFYDKEIPYEDCGSYDDGLFKLMLDMRKRIFSFTEQSNFALKDILSSILSYAEYMQEKCDSFDFSKKDIKPSLCQKHDANIKKIDGFLSELESMESNRPFKKLITDNNISQKINEFYNKHPETKKYLINIFEYFLYRHFLKGVYDDEFYSRIAFAILSTCVTALLFVSAYTEQGVFNIDTAVRCCVYYSKEIEYSESNLNIIFDAFYDPEMFSHTYLEGLCSVLL